MPAGARAGHRRDGLRPICAEVPPSEEPCDAVYARSSRLIVGKGVVTAGYAHDPRVLSGVGEEWEHFVRVDWERLSPLKVTIHPVQFTLWKLQGANLRATQSAEPAVRSGA